MVKRFSEISFVFFITKSTTYPCMLDSVSFLRFQRFASRKNFAFCVLKFIWIMQSFFRCFIFAFTHKCTPIWFISDHPKVNRFYFTSISHAHTHILMKRTTAKIVFILFVIHFFSLKKRNEIKTQRTDFAWMHIPVAAIYFIVLDVQLQHQTTRSAQFNNETNEKKKQSLGKIFIMGKVY